MRFERPSERYGRAVRCRLLLPRLQIPRCVCARVFTRREGEKEKDREREGEGEFAPRRRGQESLEREREREEEERNSRERRRNAKSDGEVGESFAKHGAYARVPSSKSPSQEDSRSAVSTYRAHVRTSRFGLVVSFGAAYREVSRVIGASDGRTRGPTRRGRDVQQTLAQH